MRNYLTIFAFVVLMASIASGDLAGYWKFDEGSGLTAADSSGNSNGGSLYAADASNYPQWISGHSGTGKALLFNASTTSSANFNSVTVALSSINPLANLSPVFTFSMWVRRDVINTAMYPYLAYTDVYDIELAKDPNSSDDWWPYDYFWSESNSNWQFKIGKETAAQKTTGNWYHLAITCDGTWLHKYVNGINVATVTVMSTTFSDIASTHLYLAATSTGSAYLVGALDDVAIWTGTYLPAAEVAKLANGTATPLTVTDETSTPSLPVMETSVFPAGWEAVWFPWMSKELSIVNGQVALFGTVILTGPDDQHPVAPWGWTIKDENTYAAVPENEAQRGVKWVDPSWSGREPNMVVIAAYITPGLILGQTDKGYHLYNPGGVNSWEDKPYFRTNIRMAAINANGASVRATIYRRSSDVEPDSTNYSTLLTYLGEIVMPLNAGDRVWQQYEFTLPKPQSSTRIPLWFELALVGGTADTVVYVDEYKPASNLYAAFKAIDLDKDSYIGEDELAMLTAGWLASTNAAILDPRSGGLLINGDFSADKALFDSSDDARVYMNPTGWTFTGTVTGNYGVQRVEKKGEMNYSWLHSLTLPAVATPLGGYAAAYTTDVSASDPYGVLEQTASAAAVAGQTYYAMGYVMTDTWYGWKDTATMSIAVNGVDKASFVRKLSRNKWRAVYGTYTATSSDAGKPIKIKFAYDDVFDPNYTSPGNMLVGYAYLGTTIPNEWPEKRPNLLVNGGFEDLSVLDANIPDGIAAVAASIRKSDNWGAWLVSDVPCVTGWVYEVPTGFNLDYTGGIWARAYYGPPLPTPGLNDVAYFVDNSLVLGQVVGPLTSGVTYYLDAACGVSTDAYSTLDWPNPVPVLHVELWRIPVGVTNGTVIYDGISAGTTGYVKVAQASVSSTGNLTVGSSAYLTPASKWQIIGTPYTATASDTNMYVRIRGTGGMSSTPEYAFSDVYLSTQKRLVPGGPATFELSSGLQYDVLGPYDCYHATAMGYTTPAVDFDGNCMTNLVDFAMLAKEWLVIGIEP